MFALLFLEEREREEKNASLKEYLNKNIDTEIEEEEEEIDDTSAITFGSLDRTDGNLKDIYSNKEKDLTGKDRNSHVASRKKNPPNLRALTMSLTHRRDKKKAEKEERFD